MDDFDLVRSRISPARVASALGAEGRRFDAVFSGTEFRPENTKKAKQCSGSLRARSCRRFAPRNWVAAIAHGATAGRSDQKE